ncbi:MAG TPA: hypothetical protein VF593_12925 [Chthoniobacteraceae bacterium]|jgi:hypothetical protein
MTRRLIDNAVENEALSRFLRTFVLLTVISVSLGALAACASFAQRNYEHISALFPELQHLDSVYIEARGFPFAQWATHDPGQSGLGVARSAFLPAGILANLTVYSVAAFFIVTPIWLLSRLTTYLRRRNRRKATASSTHNA